MKVVLKDGTQIECTPEELVQLQRIGLFGDTPKEVQVSEKRHYKPRVKHHNSNTYIKNSHFTPREDNFIIGVWNNRKNDIRLTNREYNTLERLIPNRSRKSISARLFRLRRTKNLM